MYIEVDIEPRPHENFWIKKLNIGRSERKMSGVVCRQGVSCSSPLEQPDIWESFSRVKHTHTHTFLGLGSCSIGDHSRVAFLCTANIYGRKLAGGAFNRFSRSSRKLLLSGAALAYRFSICFVFARSNITFVCSSAAGRGRTQEEVRALGREGVRRHKREYHQLRGRRRRRRRRRIRPAGPAENVRSSWKGQYSNVWWVPLKQYRFVAT